MSADVQIDVIVPTYRRPEQLRRCLLALAAQHHQPSAVIVVVRVDDEDSKLTLPAPTECGDHAPATLARGFGLR